MLKREVDSILPHAVPTEFVVRGLESDWRGLTLALHSPAVRPRADHSAPLSFSSLAENL